MLDCVCHLRSKGGSGEGEGGANAVTFKATHQGLVTECRCFRHVDVGEMLKTLPTIFFFVFYSDLSWRRNGGVSVRGGRWSRRRWWRWWCLHNQRSAKARGGVGFSGRGRGVGISSRINWVE